MRWLKLLSACERLRLDPTRSKYRKWSICRLKLLEIFKLSIVVMLNYSRRLEIQFNVHFEGHFDRQTCNNFL